MSLVQGITTLSLSPALPSMEDRLFLSNYWCLGKEPDWFKAIKKKTRKPSIYLSSQQLCVIK